MSILEWIRLALLAWDTLAQRSKSTADDKIISELRAMLDEYEAVHGSEVTKVQLESLRTTPKWGPGAE